MRCSSTVVCFVVAMLVVGLSGCHSTGSLASRSWTSSSFNPTTWRSGFKQTPSSLAAAPPAKPSTTLAPSYPNTSTSGSLASAAASTTAPPKVTYPTSPASYSTPASTALGTTSLGTTTPGTMAKNALMAPQTGRYGASPVAANTSGGFANPVYPKSGSTSPLAHNPYRSMVPTAPSSNGSLGGPTASPYADNTNSRYQAAISSSAAMASTPSYSNDPNSRYYAGSANSGLANESATTAPPFTSQNMPKVVGGYPTTSPGSPVISTAQAPSGRYPNIQAPSYPNSAPTPVNVTSPINSSMPVQSSATTAPPAYQPGASEYQPGASEYQPGQNGYTPGQNGYQVPAVRSTDPIQSNSQTTPDLFPMVPPATSDSGGQAPVFRPGSTGSVPAYTPATGSASPYSSSHNAMPVSTSVSSSSVVPAGFNQVRR